MRVIALMSWYDEPPLHLAATVASCSRLCDHVVAVDGAYAHFPGGRPSSGAEQSQAIREAAEAVGLGCTIHVPTGRWEGDEVAKRSAMFALGGLMAGPEDWFLVIDADEVLIEASAEARTVLAETGHVVAEVMHTVHRDLGPGRESRRAAPARRLFRALPGLRVAVRHWHYLAERDGRTVQLWGDGLAPLEPAEQLHDVRMLHRSHLRPPRRAAAARDYYRIRDDHGLEAMPVLMEGLDGDLVQVR